MFMLVSTFLNIWKILKISALCSYLILSFVSLWVCFYFFPLSQFWGTCFWLFSCLLSFYWMLDTVSFQFSVLKLIFNIIKKNFCIPLNILVLFGTQLVTWEQFYPFKSCRSWTGLGLIWPHHWDNALMNWQMLCVLGGASPLAGWTTTKLNPVWSLGIVLLIISQWFIPKPWALSLYTGANQQWAKTKTRGPFSRSLRLSLCCIVLRN